MIDWAKTKNKFGYDSSTVRSSSKIIAICDKCGKIRELRNRDYRPLCRSCSISIASKKKWKRRNQKFKSQHKQKCRENALNNQKELSDNLKERWNNNRDEMMLMNSDHNKRKQTSDSMKKKWEDINYRNKMIEIWEDESLREKASKIAKKLWENHDYREKVIATKNRPEVKEKITIARASQPKVSNIQTILYSILDDLHIKYFREYNDRQDDPECVIGPWSFDCVIPIKNQKTLLIDCNGNYWHGKKQQIARDKAKSSYIANNLSHLYDFKYLWEHEFDNKNRIISLLRHWLKLEEPEIKSFNFNDISETIIDHKATEIFISKYHYAGRIGRSGINLGYHVDNALMTAIIYSYPVRNETSQKQHVGHKEILELSRLAIHPQYQAKNLASHLISRSINYIKKNKPEIKILVSFSDKTYNHLGTIYKASNWTEDGVVKPSYWYVDKDGWVCHKKTLWNKASKMSMTEKEYREKYEYTKVMGAEKIRFIYKLL